MSMVSVCKPLTIAVGGFDILIKQTNYSYLPLFSTLCLSQMTLNALERELMNATVVEGFVSLSDPWRYVV